MGRGAGNLTRRRAVAEVKPRNAKKRTKREIGPGRGRPRPPWAWFSRRERRGWESGRLTADCPGGYTATGPGSTRIIPRRTNSPRLRVRKTPDSCEPACFCQMIRRSVSVACQSRFTNWRGSPQGVRSIRKRSPAEFFPGSPARRAPAASSRAASAAMSSTCSARCSVAVSMPG